MHRFKNILAVYGDQIGSEDVLSQAIALASANTGHLTLIDVVPGRYATPAIVRERQKRLRRIKSSIDSDKISSINIVISVGTPFQKIILQVLKNNHDLVMSGPGDERSLGNLYFSSTTTHLMRKCPCPVWIIDPGRSARLSRIMACIDPKDNLPANNALDYKILSLATSLARSNKADLHIIHAWDVEGNDRDTLNSEVPQTTREKILENHRNNHQQRVDELLKDFKLEDKKYHVHLPRTTKPENAINELAHDKSIELIVMGTVSRTGISGLIIGNAAESVLGTVRCGVFAVKPDGFQSPVVWERELELVEA